MTDIKIIKIYEDKKHVEFDCGNGVIQRTQDQFAPSADQIKEKVAQYCELYLASTPVAETIAPAEVTKMRAIENKTFKITDVVAVSEEIIKE